MLNQVQNSLSWLVLLAASATVSASAARVKNILLPLVPPDTEVVSGIANPGTPGATGRLLLVTDRNNRDFSDCLALLGIDGERSIEQVIQAASSSSSADRGQYLLLLAGSFNHLRIYKAALESGAASLDRNGAIILAISPFQREQKRSIGVRWLAILDERIAVFGTPAMVGNALDRHARGEPTDPMLLRRLGQIHVDVDPWSVIALQPPMLERYLADFPLSAAERTTLKGVDELAVGIHYGPIDRVDFALHMREGTASVERLLAAAQLISASMTSVRQFHLDKEPTGSDRFRGSFRIRDKELDRWLASVDKTAAVDQQIASKE